MNANPLRISRIASVRITTRSYHALNPRESDELRRWRSDFICRLRRRRAATLYSCHVLKPRERWR